eukprot:9401177-Pyramimonas_sp.AAC.1
MAASRRQRSQRRSARCSQGEPSGQGRGRDDSPRGWTEAPHEPKEFNPAKLEEHLRLATQGPDAK